MINTTSPLSSRSGKAEPPPHLVIKLLRPSSRTSSPSGRPVPPRGATAPRAPRLAPLRSDEDLLEMEPLVLDPPVLSDAARPSRSSTPPPRLRRKLAPSSSFAPDMEPLTLPAALDAKHTPSPAAPPSAQISLYREMHTAAFSALRDHESHACAALARAQIAGGGHRSGA